MADYQITIEGIEPLQRKLQNLSQIRFEAVAKKQLTQMLERARSPGGTPVDTGELRKSSGISGDAMGYTKEYAPHVEYGHRTGGGGFVQGQHFLQDNVEKQRTIYKNDLIEAIKKEKS